MSSKRWISFPKAEGEYSRQAHADLPAGTYEREMGKEGFFGPSCHFHHLHPPTGWTSFEGEAASRMPTISTLLPSDPAIPVGSRPFYCTTTTSSCAGGVADRKMDHLVAQFRRRRTAVHPRG